jgi:SAM-dependent methyltransferase
MRHWRRCRRACAWMALVLFGIAAAHAQERFSLFVPSDPKNVERMVRLADLRDGDVVVDLGSGDGRVVFAAAQANQKVRGIGVDIDATLVKQAAGAAQKAGLADRVEFQHRNAFDLDLSKVDVIFMWFFPELMRLLRVKILQEARPGTRVVASLWDFGSWKPDAVDKDPTDVNLWIVPAKVGGYWNWQLAIGGVQCSYASVFEQHFQALEGVVRAGKRHGILNDVKLRGEEISFVLMMTLEELGFTRHEFTLPWSATRSARAAYLDPVGVDIR